VNDTDLTRLPRGQREWPEFVETLSCIDDRAERYFLELKSEVDLATERGQAKVAKFILGAANRMPDRAAKRFNGHALLVLGITKGVVTGIPFFEAKDLERGVKKFIGADGPGWDFERVRVDEDRDVIVVVVDPPHDGDPVWTCCKDGPENLKDGGIYIRADGETREAKGDEVRVLLRRAQQPRLATELDIAVLGAALPYHCNANVLDEYVSAERQRLIAAYDQCDNRLADAYSQATRMAGWQSSLFREEPEKRTYEQYMTEIDDWETQFRKAWPDMLDDVAAVIWPGARVRARNLSRMFLEDVEVGIHLEGEVWALAKIDDDDHNFAANLPSAPRVWGPRQRPHDFGVTFFPSTSSHYMPSVAGLGSGAVSFRNGDSVDLTLSLKQLRPEEAFESDDDEFILVVRNAETQRVTGTWRVTARGHHVVYEGTLSIDVGESRDFSDGIRHLLMPKVNESEDDQI